MPRICTHGYMNRAVWNDHWRYFRCADGSEELYDHADEEEEEVVVTKR